MISQAEHALALSHRTVREACAREERLAAQLAHADSQLVALGTKVSLLLFYAPFHSILQLRILLII